MLAKSSRASFVPALVSDESAQTSACVLTSALIRREHGAPCRRRPAQRSPHGQTSADLECVSASLERVILAPADTLLLRSAVRLEIGMWDEAVNVSLRREIVDAEL